MKYAQIRVLAETPPGGLTAGIDWGSADHAICAAQERMKLHVQATRSKASLRSQR